MGLGRPVEWAQWTGSMVPAIQRKTLAQSFGSVFSFFIQFLSVDGLETTRFGPGSVHMWDPCVRGRGWVQLNILLVGLTGIGSQFLR